MADAVQMQLDCGIGLAVLEMPHRRAVASEMRVLTGVVNEPADKLGLAHLVEQTVDKGTQDHTGRELQDEFDKIGTGVHSWCGKQASGFTSLCLPEYFARNIELQAELLRTPTFPKDSCDVAIELARQELMSLEDDAQGLADKHIGRQAMGPLLGRHTSGESETLANIYRDDFVSFWQSNYAAGKMQVSIVGPMSPSQVADIIEARFSGFGDKTQTNRDIVPVEFDAVAKHHDKQTEQEHMVIALQGVRKSGESYSAARILMGVLAGGMSARLFTEVREKLGLVYWVGGWQEHPRGAGLMYFGASTTPERCSKTYETMLAELARVGKDVTQEEVDRARTGIEVRFDIRGDVTRALCSELADDLMHFGRPVPREDKLKRLRDVTIDDVKRFWEGYVQDAPRSVVTLGPKALDS